MTFRRTVEKVESDNSERAAKGLPPRLVQPADINSTYNEMISAGQAVFVKSATLHEKILLLSLARTIRSSGLAHVEFQIVRSFRFCLFSVLRAHGGDQVMRYHLRFCQQVGFEPVPSHDALFAILKRLASMRLLVAESGRLDYWQRVQPNVRDTDLELVLRGDKDLGRHVGRNGLL
jgi:hypothetical protein